MTKAGKRLLSAAKEMTEMADWKARAEAAEARVKELEAQEPVLFVVGASLRYRILETEDAELAKEIAADYNKPVFPLYAAPVPRLTVTDEMVERAEAELDALFSGSPNCTLSDIARAALTAALETRHD